jgi:hypothetical protein
MQRNYISRQGQVFSYSFFSAHVFYSLSCVLCLLSFIFVIGFLFLIFVL